MDVKRRPLQQPWPVRATHWLNVPLLVLLAASGLQILSAYPKMGPQGAPAGWYPFQGTLPPRWLTAGGWLAGARHVHFALGWFLVANGIIYLAYLIASGEWRRRAFSLRRDTVNAAQTGLHYLRIRRSPPEQGLYNGLQRLAYTSVILICVVEVLSGLAIWKPVQLHGLAAVFGGYDGARAIHLLGLAALALFTLVHLVLVALHPRELWSMLTGGKRA
jgi:thiosulfate reductase cytochrome b subunit